ncbi:MAG: hypothetical protein ACE5F1_10590 [Planctomycetota bacterium]
MSEEKPGRSNGLNRAIGIVVVIAAVVGYKFYNKSTQSSEVKRTSATWFLNAPGYAKSKAVFDSLLDECHEVAFKKSYSMGGRRRAAKFNADAYAKILFSTMKSRAEARGHPEIAKSIGVVQANYGAKPGR